MQFPLDPHPDNADQVFAAMNHTEAFQALCLRRVKINNLDYFKRLTYATPHDIVEATFLGAMTQGCHLSPTLEIILDRLEEKHRVKLILLGTTSLDPDYIHDEIVFAQPENLEGFLEEIVIQNHTGIHDEIFEHLVEIHQGEISPELFITAVRNERPKSVLEIFMKKVKDFTGVYQAISLVFPRDKRFINNILIRTKEFNNTLRELLSAKCERTPVLMLADFVTDFAGTFVLAVENYNYFIHQSLVDHFLERDPTTTCHLADLIQAKRSPDLVLKVAKMAQSVDGLFVSVAMNYSHFTEQWLIDYFLEHDSTATSCLTDLIQTKRSPDLVLKVAKMTQSVDGLFTLVALKYNYIVDKELVDYFFEKDSQSSSSIKELLRAGVHIDLVLKVLRTSGDYKDMVNFLLTGEGRLNVSTELIFGLIKDVNDFSAFGDALFFAVCRYNRKKDEWTKATVFHIIENMTEIVITQRLVSLVTTEMLFKMAKKASSVVGILGNIVNNYQDTHGMNDDLLDCLVEKGGRISGYTGNYPERLWKYFRPVVKNKECFICLLDFIPSDDPGGGSTPGETPGEPIDTLKCGHIVHKACNVQSFNCPYCRAH